MLKIYRRHSVANCGRTDRDYRRCNCPIWADGSLNGKRFHKSLKTRNWDRAQKLVREKEIEGKDTDEGRTTIPKLTAAYIKDAEARGLKESSLYKYKLLFRRLEQFSKDENVKYISEIDLDFLRRFRSTWKLKNFAARVTTENMRALMRFAHESGWISTNPGKLLKSPEVRGNPVVPFSPEDMEKILKACDSYRTINNGIPIKAFVLLLRYSGLRIRDAVSLQRSKLDKDKLLLFTAKTGTPVHLPLPPACVEALNEIPSNGTGYFFWSGEGKIKVRVGNFQAALKRLFELAKVDNGYAHKFRHAFATSLLLRGVPVERVAILLGHASVKVTQKHYSSWIAARQEQLEADVRATWDTAAT